MRYLSMRSLANRDEYAASVRDRMEGAGVTPADVAAVFSSAVLKDLAHPNPGRASRRLAGAALLVADRPEATVADALEEAHRMLLRDYRSEYVFKNTLVSKLVFGYHNPNTASALLELPMGNSCADVMIVNGTSTVYEVKTDLDQFNRLQSQLPDYQTRSEHVYVVVSEGRAAAAEARLTAGVGLIALTKRGYLRKLRDSASNLEKLVPEHLFNLLRRNEVLNVLGRTLGYELDVAPIDAWRRTRELFLELSVTTAHQEAIAELRGRGRGAAELVKTDGFPSSLRALAYSSELSAVGRLRVATKLNEPASLFLEY